MELITYTVFIKFVHVIIPKSRRTIIVYQLNSLLENCLKTQLVGFGRADVLGFTLVSNAKRKISKSNKSELWNFGTYKMKKMRVFQFVIHF